MEYTFIIIFTGSMAISLTLLGMIFYVIKRGKDETQGELFLSRDDYYNKEYYPTENAGNM